MRHVVNFAQEGKGVGPQEIADLADDKRWEYVSKRWGGEQWRINELRDLVDDGPIEGPFVHLIPAARFQFSKPKEQPNVATPVQVDSNRRVVRKVVAKEDRVVLAFELRPFVDDGKHWVLYTDGNCDRTEIDDELLATHKVEIRPIVGQDRPGVGAERPNLEYRLVLVASQKAPASLSADGAQPRA